MLKKQQLRELFREGFGKIPFRESQFQSCPSYDHNPTDV